MTITPVPYYLGLMRYIGCTACAQEESAAAVDVVRGRAGTDVDSDLARTYAAESTRLFGETETESAWDTVLEMEPEPLAPGYVPSEITAIHSRFITPPTNNNPIRTQ